jgi:pyridoxine kinase
MFAALTVARLREAAFAQGLCDRVSWLSDDDVEPLQLPLAKAVEKVCASMHTILEKTKMEMDREVKLLESQGIVGRELELKRTKAAEVKAVRHQDDLRKPVVLFQVEEVVG